MAGGRTERRPYGEYAEAPRYDASVGYRDPRRYRRQLRGRGTIGRPSDVGLGLVCVVAIAVMGLCAWIGMALTQPATREQAELPTRKVTHDSMCTTQTYDGETIRWYVMVDPDYRIQYLVNDRGGCCVRLDDEGNVMGLSAKEEDGAEGYDYEGYGGYDE